MTTTSREYAEALFELSAEDRTLQETAEGLDLMKTVLTEEPGYLALLASPAIGKEKRLKALDDAFRGKLPDALLGVMRMMIARGHVNLLDDMALEFEKLARDARGESVALVTSAVPLSEAETAKLKAGLEKKFGRRFTLQCAVDPSLIGGVRVEAEGSVIDGSIRNKLDQIKEVMHS